MSDGFNVKIVGGPELARKLAQLSDVVAGKALERATLAGALLVQNAAKEKAPYRTGTLRRSIHSEVTETSKTRCEVEVGTDVVYARIQEYGGVIKPKGPHLLRWKDAKSGQWYTARQVTLPAHPYLRPAFDEKGTAAVREIGEALKILLSRVAAT